MAIKSIPVLTKAQQTVLRLMYPNFVMEIWKGDPEDQIRFDSQKVKAFGNAGVLVEIKPGIQNSLLNMGLIEKKGPRAPKRGWYYKLTDLGKEAALY